MTYLFEGVLLHSDSLKVVQEIHPGAVNWMTAGRGIVHSERSPNAGRSRERRLHGIQTWLALPEEHEETEPWFRHYSATDIPTLHLPPLDFIDSETLHVIIDTPNCKTIPSARRLKRSHLTAGYPHLDLPLILTEGLFCVVSHLLHNRGSCSPRACGGAGTLN